MITAGCAPAEAPAPLRTESTPANSAAFEVESQERQLPSDFGFGAPASDERIARWDIDIKPDGEGLPTGRGTVSEGATLYAIQCAVCHGATGIEGPDVALAEPGGSWEDTPTSRAIGVYWPHATTLYDYIQKAMPMATPGTLTPDETYAVIAYLLHINGLVPADAELDAASLVAIEMPARDRFVPDDRPGGATIR
ncbi:MAG: c-type cytochrome [Acidobacteria bacterium]|nr:c-type cytochrome [Acidobacteriota bacterium]